MRTHTVEILITVTQTEDKLSDEPQFIGEYVLRAFDADGTLIREAREQIPLEIATSDCARLVTLAAALKRLHGKLEGDSAWYTLRIVQSSKNVDGWLSKGWKRNVESVRKLTAIVDVLLKLFPQCEFVQVSRAELDAQIATGKVVMTTA